MRAAFARLIGAAPDEIAFLFATSEGENIVACGLDLAARRQRRRRRAALQHDVRALPRIWKRRAASTLRIVKHATAASRRRLRACRGWPDAAGLGGVGVASERLPARDAAARRPGARATAPVSMPTRCRRVGMFPVDVRAAGVDCLTAGTYKWLLGGFGVAPFFIRRELLDRIPLDRLGALHVEKELGDHRYEIYRTAKKFEYATLAFGPVYQLGAALSYLERVGVARIERHTVAWPHELRAGCARRAPGCSRPPATARRSSPCEPST